MSRIRLDDLVGRRVRDANGAVIGRVYDVRAEEDGDDLVIVEYHVGRNALLNRIGFSLLRMVGIRHEPEPHRIPWDRLDISDPEHPILKPGSG